MSTGNPIEPSMLNVEREALTGRYDHRLDPKRRFTIPLRWFERLGNPPEVYVMRSLTQERCLDVFAPSELDDRLRPFRNRALTDAKVAKFLRELSERTDLVSVDSQNRIRVSDEMLSYAGLESDIVLYGSGTHFEIWSLANRPKQAINEVERVENLADIAKELNF